MLALLVSAFSWSLGSLLSPRVPRPSSPLLGASMQMLVGGTYLLLTGLATGERIVPAKVSALSLASLVYLAVFGSLVGFTVYLWLMRVASPALVSTYACVNPVVAVFLGAVFLAEPVTPRMLLATAAIVGAVALVVSAKPKPSDNRDSTLVLPRGAARPEARTA